MEDKTVKIYLQGLNCAHCAGKIEEAVNKQQNVEQAKLNFINKTILVTTKQAQPQEEVLEQVKSIVNSIESGVDVKLAEKKKGHRHSEDEHHDEEHEHHHEHGEHCGCGHHHDEEHEHHHEHGEHCGCEHHHDEEHEHHHEHGEHCGCGHHHDEEHEHHHEQGEHCGCEHHHDEEHEHHHEHGEHCDCEHHHDEENHIDEKDFEAGKNTVKILLKGLNCAHCAGKIEEAVNSCDNIESAKLNFISKEFFVTPSEKTDSAVILKQVADIVNSIESGVETSLIDGKKSKNDGGENEDEESGSLKNMLIRFGAGIVLYIAALVAPDTINSVIFAAAYVVFGYDVIIRAFKNICRGQIFDENFLMVVASMGAFAISIFTPNKEYSEAVAVMLFYQIGEFLQDRAVDKSRRSIRGLMDLQSESANVIIDGEVQQIEPDEIEVGDICIVKSGEKIPVDGVITEGSTSLDMSALTGEAAEVSVKEGDSVISGSINKNAVIYVRAEKEYSNSTVARIMDMVENAVTNKSSTESFITKFAKIYTPAVCGAAVVLAVLPPLFCGAVLGSGYDFIKWIERALIFLVSSCPCALVVSIPLTFFSGLGVSSKNGVLIKGSNYLQTLADVNTIVFDKTGTITQGKFAVTNVEGGNDVIRYAAGLEIYSNHPIAKAITQYYAGMGEYIHPDNIEEIKGMGITGEYEGKRIAVGNSRLMKKLGIKYEENDSASVYAAADGAVIGTITIEDAVKPDSVKAVSMFKKLGISNIVMLTGDKLKNAEKTAKQIGIKKYYAELLPQNKVEKLEEIYAQNPDTKAVFVGDGINDAPVLARADVGAAMGEIGSDAAIEAADVVIMHDEISKLAQAIKIARKTMATARQNVAIVLVIKFGVLALAVFGFANMWLAVFADVGVALIAIANSLRILNVK